MKNKPRFVYLIIGGVLGLIVGIAASGIWRGPHRFQGSLIDPPVQAANFSLTDQLGRPFSLDDQHGKVVLMFFGYTHCPDVCPVTLTVFKRIKSDLGDLSENARFVFITVDPERDTPEQLAEHLRRFDPDFIGLTGDLSELEAVWQKYGVYRARQETASVAGYLVDHTARIFVIDRTGNWRLTYPFEMEAEAITSDVRYLIEKESFP